MCIKSSSLVCILILNRSLIMKFLNRRRTNNHRGGGSGAADRGHRHSRRDELHRRKRPTRDGVPRARRPLLDPHQHQHAAHPAAGRGAGDTRRGQYRRPAAAPRRGGRTGVHAQTDVAGRGLSEETSRAKRI